jgi:hypothetical protein
LSSSQLHFLQANLPQEKQGRLQGDVAYKLGRSAVVNLEALEVGHDAQVGRNALHVFH